MTGKVECGQGARAELTQAAAEELRVAPSSIKLIMADTSLFPDDAGTFGSQTTPQMASQLRRVAAAAREALSEVRTAVIGMKGASLAFELDKARQALAAANVTAEISALTTDGYPGQEAVLAMALREGVTNVIRHSGATRCEIRLAPSATDLVLSISDDGQGGRLVEGSGLKGMRARLAAIGGALDIKSDKNGTRLTATAPLKHIPGEAAP